VQPSKWLLEHPQTSADAARQAERAIRRSVWQPLVAFAILVVTIIPLTVFAGVNGGLLLMASIAGSVGVAALLHAQAIVLREAYHRLLAEGK
jgi:hypothetical protein